MKSKFYFLLILLLYFSDQILDDLYGLEDYDENNDKAYDQASDIENLSDHLKINEGTRQHMSPYTSDEDDEDDELTEDDKSEIIGDISDGILIL